MPRLNERLLILSVIAMIVLSYLIIAVVRHTAGLEPKRFARYAIEDIEHHFGLAYSAPITLAHGLTQKNRAAMVVLEDGQPIGDDLFHRVHQVVTKGLGRSCLLEDQLYFSTSDNTDPRTNGRRYEVLLPQPVSDVLLPALLVTWFIGAAGIIVWIVVANGPSQGWTPFTFKALALFACILIGAGLSSLLIRKALPQFDEAITRVKFERWEEVCGEVDAIFIGSSRVYRQIAPEVFDSIVSEQSSEFKSFNFGIQALRPLEMHRLLENIFKTRGSRLRWVFIDFESLKLDIDEENLLSTRVVNWHDPKRTRLVLKIIASSDFSLAEKAVLIDQHMRPSLTNLLNLGKIKSAIKAIFNPPEGPQEFLLGPSGDGWVSLDQRVIYDPDLPRLKWNEEFLVDQKGYLDEVDRLRVEIEVDPKETADSRFLSVILNQVRAAGAEPVIVLGPVVERRLWLKAAVRNGIDAQYLFFHNPDRYPSLYEPAVRFDRGHLNEKGARRYTRLLALRFIGEIVEETDNISPVR